MTYTFRQRCSILYAFCSEFQMNIMTVNPQNMTNAIEDLTNAFSAIKDLNK